MTERSSIDDIIDVYKRDVDVSLIESNLKRTVEERLEALMQLQALVEEFRKRGWMPTTDLGDIDTLWEVGDGGYNTLLRSTVRLRAFGLQCRLLNLDRLIEVKRAAGRPKDFEAIAELEIIRDRRKT
jgi:hypothetical protein